MTPAAGGVPLDVWLLPQEWAQEGRLWLIPPGATLW